MRTYDESGAEFIGVIVLIVIAIPFCIATPLWIVYELGFDQEADQLRDWILAQDVWLRLLCFAGIGLVGFFILLVAGITVFQIGNQLLLALVAFTEWLIAATLKSIAVLQGLTATLIASLLWLIALPFRFLADAIHDGLIRVQQAIGSRIEEKRQLRTLYYEEYADDFASFWAFKRYWDALQRGEEPPYPGHEEEKEKPHFDPGPRPNPKPRADPYKQALAELGLSGTFTKAEFKARYRMRMKKVHPDITGSNSAAVRVNAARDLINQRKGWS